MMPLFKSGLASTLLLLAAGTAFASTPGESEAPWYYEPAVPSFCESLLTSVASNPASLSSAQASHPECFAGTNTSASQQQTQATSFQQVSLISNVIASRLLFGAGHGDVQKKAELSGRTGLAAGNAAGWNAWGSAANTSAKYDGFGAASTGMYESDILNFVAGGDYRLAPNLILGVSVAIDSGSGHAGTSQSALSTEGYAIAPYLGWQINQNLAFDATLGFGAGKAMIGTGETDSDRLFYGANLSYARWMGELQLTARLGYLGSVEDNDNTTVAGVDLAGTGGKNKLDQMRLGVQAGYWLLDGIMPYLGLTATQDLRRTSLAGEDADKSAFLVSAGINFMSLPTGTTLGIAYIHELGRSDSSNNNLMANLNIRF